MQALRIEPGSEPPIQPIFNTFAYVTVSRHKEMSDTQTSDCKTLGKSSQFF